MTREERHSTPPASRRRKPRAKQLGVDDATYRAMLEEQHGGCAICGSKPRTRRLHVDHDHKTGRVRGLLCYRDNRLLLMSGVTAARLDAAADYLRRTAPVVEEVGVVGGKAS